MTSFLGIGKGSVQGPVAHSPRAAAEQFFQAHPRKQYVHVEEGEGTPDRWHAAFGKHRVWRNIARAQISTLPEK